MQTLAVIMTAPEKIVLDTVETNDPVAGDVVVEIDWSGISTGTERLLYQGRMPPFPGMGYPLVPGYESVGRVVRTTEGSSFREGDTVFVPGATCFKSVRGLFGGAARRLVVPAARLVPVGPLEGVDGTLLALAATAHHAAPVGNADKRPDLIIGHGTLGRLLARLTVLDGGPPPVVWETNLARHSGAQGYQVVSPDDDPRRDYSRICDVSGDASLLDTLIQRLAPGGEIVLAGFYAAPLTFSFAPAFMREARIRIAAQWQPADIAAVSRLMADGQLKLDGLITHTAKASDAPEAYGTAFGTTECLKMVLDWRQLS